MTTRLAPVLTFDHLNRLSDRQGLFEHALLSEPRRTHGYCVDDVARGLVVVCREHHRTPVLHRLERLYLDFVVDAIDREGRCHNRMTVDGDWRDDASLGDWWGRALWGLGTAAVRGSTPGLRARALFTFRVAAGQRSPHTRAMAGAALGAAEVLGAFPGETARPRIALGGRGRNATTGPGRPGLALAGASPALRQRHPSAGLDRRGRVPVPAGPCSPAGSRC